MVFEWLANNFWFLLDFLRSNLTVMIMRLVLAAFVLVSLFNLATALASLKKEKKYEQTFPQVSVIIRTWNDGAVVERCIKNLLNQDYPKEKYEIIIADDGSTDNTREICEKYQKSGKILYVRFPEHLEFKADVIDPIIKNNATGEIIIETDVDFVLPKNWISGMTNPFSDESVKAVTGRVFCGNWYKTWISHLRAVEDFWHFCTAMYGRFALAGQGTLYGSSKAYKKSVWDELGGHPRHIVEDAAFMTKLMEHGHKIINVKTTNMGEEVETVEQYVAERKRWAGGNLSIFEKHKNILSRNFLFHVLMISNFSIDAIFLFSIFLMFFERLFIMPIFITIVAFWIGLWSVNARDEFYLWTIFYVVFGPLLQIIALIGALKDKLIKGKLVWEKVRHYPTELIMPTKEK